MMQRIMFHHFLSRRRSGVASFTLFALLAATSAHGGWRDLVNGTGRKAVSTFGEWRDAMFGAIKDDEPLGPENADLPIVPTMNVPERFAITPLSPEAAFPEGTSHYRMIELSREFAHVAVRLRVMAVPNPKGRGNSVFKPIIYVLDDAEQAREQHLVDPLLLDMQPFKRTRLLACTSLENVRRFVIATPAKAVGTFYETAARDAVSAPKTSYGFHYTTESIKAKLPYAATGELVIEVTEEATAGAGCDGKTQAKKPQAGAEDAAGSEGDGKEAPAKE